MFGKMAVNIFIDYRPHCFFIKGYCILLGKSNVDYKEKLNLLLELTNS